MLRGETRQRSVMLLPALARMLGLPSIEREGTATREAETLPPWILQYYRQWTVELQTKVREDFTIAEAFSYIVESAY